jgi:hypothetical protein
MPIPPVDVPVNQTGQWIMTIAVIVALLAAAIAAVRVSRRLRSWAPTTMLAGSLLAGFIEPIYCSTMHLWYYRPGQWTMYSAMGISQPVWSWLSYGAFYGGLTLLVWWRIEQGASRASITKLGAVLIGIGIATEIACIRLGTYEYYGPHPFRVLSFPVWISVANAVIGIVAGVAAARLRPLLSGPQTWAYIALVPATMTAIQFGTGFLALDVINTPHPASWLQYLTATASMALAATVGYLALQLVPAQPVGSELQQPGSRHGSERATSPTA